MTYIATATVTENLLKRKWSIIILRYLSNGPANPAEICKLEPGLTTVALNERLRTMQRYGLITRHPRRVSAMSIVCQLTDRGHKILRLLTLIEQLDELPNQDEIVLRRTPIEAPPPVRVQRPRPSTSSRSTRKQQASLAL